MCSSTGENTWKSGIWYLMGLTTESEEGQEKGEQGKRGREREYVYMCICMYTTSQSNKPPNENFDKRYNLPSH